MHLLFQSIWPHPRTTAIWSVLSVSHRTCMHWRKGCGTMIPDKEAKIGWKEGLKDFQLKRVSGFASGRDTLSTSMTVAMEEEMKTVIALFFDIAKKRQQQTNKTATTHDVVTAIWRNSNRPRRFNPMGSSLVGQCRHHTPTLGKGSGCARQKTCIYKRVCHILKPWQQNSIRAAYVAKQGNAELKVTVHSVV